MKKGFVFRVETLEVSEGKWDVSITKTWYGASVEAELDILQLEVKLLEGYLSKAQEIAFPKES